MLSDLQKRGILASIIAILLIGCILVYHETFRAEFVFNYGPAWSPSGNDLVYVCYKPTVIDLVFGGPRYYGDIPYDPRDSEICVMSAEKTNQRRLTHNREHDHSPAWSPNGDKIAFISTQGVESYLCLMNIDGEQCHIFNNTKGIVDFAWSPEGEQIAYSDSEVGIGSPGHIYVLDVESGDTRLLYRRTGSRFPVWSPDSKSIAFVSGVGTSKDCELRIIDIETKEETIAPLPASCYGPSAWSPDGLNMALVGPQATTLLVFDIHSQSLRVVSEGVDGISDLFWSPDGTTIFGLVGGCRPSRIKLDNDQWETIDLNGAFNTYYSYGCFGFAVSPDGTRLAFDKARERESDIWIIDLRK